MQKLIVIKNKKANFEYELIDFYSAGIVLSGTEIKSIRQGRASIVDSFCSFNDKKELFVINMHVEQYSQGGYVKHKIKADRKLLLEKKELIKLKKQLQNIGLTIIPTKLYINQKGLAKLDIALAKGKKNYDKRQKIMERENKREISRLKKQS